MSRTAGIQLHVGKYPVGRWNRAGIRPPNMDDLGDDVWIMESRYWGLQGAPRRSFRHSPIDGSRKNDASGTRSRQCLISNVRGSCCCNVQAYVVIMCCGPCLHHNQRGMPLDTTKGCTRPWWLCWALFWENTSRSPVHLPLLRFQREWEDWDSDPRDDSHQPPIGPHGRMLWR